MKRLSINTPAKRVSAALPDDANELGPAMQALNIRQRAFVDALFVLGSGGTYTKAAEMAGYEGNGNALATQGHRLAHSEKIQAAIREEANRRTVANIPVMTAKLQSIALNDDHRKQYDAVVHSLGLAGVSPKIQHEVVHKTDRGSLLQEIAGAVELLKQIGVKVDLAEPEMIDITPEKLTPEDAARTREFDRYQKIEEK